MKITDQVPALEMMAIDPVQFIISPKDSRGTHKPAHTNGGFSNLVGILGGYT